MSKASSSLAAKLSHIFFLSNAFTILVCTFAYTLVVIFYSTRSFTVELHALAKVIAGATRASLAFRDVESANRILNSLKARPEIVVAEIFFADGSYFVGIENASSSSRSLDLNLKQNSEYSKILWRKIIVEIGVPIELDGERIGYLKIGASLRALFPQLLLFAGISLVIGAIVGLGSLSFFRHLNQEVSDPVRALGSLALKISHTKDFTSRLEADSEDEISQLIKAFNHMLGQLEERDKSLRFAKEKAEQADRAKSLFVASMSHELRTPLHSIIGLSNEILLTPLSNEQKELMLALNNSGDTLLRIINEILDFSKIEAGKLVLEEQPFSLPELLERISTIFRLSLTKKNIVFSIQIAEHVPKMIVADSGRLSQILINLIGNAIKFTPLGGKIRVEVQNSQGVPSRPSLSFSVSDTGIGIAEGQREYIFDLFTQIKSKTDVIQGTGLGLAICSRLVKLMGGWIWVESELGKGSTFHFVIDFKDYLPGTVASDSAPRDNGNPENVLTNELEYSGIARPRVIVAEDNLVNQRLLQRLLRKSGFEVFIASNGLECIDLFSSERVEVVVMDINMPELDGLAATKKIREMEKKISLKPCLIIAATASIGPDETGLCFEAGMNAFLLKPFKISELKKCFMEHGISWPADTEPAAMSGVE